jgi:hypothetical protein
VFNVEFYQTTLDINYISHNRSLPTQKFH